MTADEQSNVGSGTASCAAGDIAISGGVSTETDGWAVHASNPSSTAGNPTGWFGEIIGNGEGGDGTDGADDESADDGQHASSSDSKVQSKDQVDDPADDQAGDGGAASGKVYVLCVTP